MTAGIDQGIEDAEAEDTPEEWPEEWDNDDYTPVGKMIRGDMAAVKGGIALAGWLLIAILPSYVNYLDSGSALFLLLMLVLVPLVGLLKADRFRAGETQAGRVRGRAKALLLAPTLAVAPPVIVGWATHFHLWVAGAPLGFALGLVPLGMLWRRGRKARLSLLVLVPAYILAMGAFCLLCLWAQKMD
jgi:hypothetical protein